MAACDTGTAPKGQGQAGAAEKAGTASAVELGLESANGMQATLSYRFAGQAAPAATFTGADGRDVSLSDFAGKPLLVNIWATWCAPCKAEMPTLDALAALEKGQLSVIAVSQDLQGSKPVLAFFNDTGIGNLEPYTDSENALSAAFDHQLALPTTILYDGDGREVWRVIGGVEWDDAAMAELLREAT
ncbi:MAG: TlpA family protein disulfide reductase [Sphingomonadaceae bacterium]|nr:TlpA family protein disulfide reductase [Sphingomonadaceae bacterium]